MSMYTVGLHAKFLRDEISSVGKMLVIPYRTPGHL